MQAPAIEFSKVTKWYGDQLVLDSLDLLVEAGEFFALVGVNGAGKTTCIKGMLDFCELRDGCIEIFGVPYKETRARTRLTYLPERFLPPYYLTGADFLSYVARLHSVRFADSDIEHIFGLLDLQLSVLSQPVRHYSKGMAQKLGLASCFLSKKELFVLDEPMSGLDPKARTLTKRHLLELKSKGHTLFFSTHMLSDVHELCDRMGILHGGSLRFVGTPEICCRHYGQSSLEAAYLECISAS